MLSCYQIFSNKIFSKRDIKNIFIIYQMIKKIFSHKDTLKL